MPSPAAKPRTNVVLPVPSSPVRRTTSPGRTSSPTRRPRPVVSAAERVRTTRNGIRTSARVRAGARRWLGEEVELGAGVGRGLGSFGEHGRELLEVVGDALGGGPSAQSCGRVVGAQEDAALVC